MARSRWPSPLKSPEMTLNTSPFPTGSGWDGLVAGEDVAVKLYVPAPPRVCTSREYVPAGT